MEIGWVEEIFIGKLIGTIYLHLVKISVILTVQVIRESKLLKGN